MENVSGPWPENETETMNETQATKIQIADDCLQMLRAAMGNGLTVFEF